MNRLSKRLCALALLFSCFVFATACREENDEPATVTSDVQAPKPPEGAHNYGGAVDSITCDFISGWVWNSSGPSEEIDVDVFVDGQMVGTVPAAISRPDLRTLGGSGDYGFSITTPKNLKDGQPHSVAARVSGGTYDIKVWERIQASFVCKPR